MGVSSNKSFGFGFSCGRYTQRMSCITPKTIVPSAATPVPEYRSKCGGSVTHDQKKKLCVAPWCASLCAGDFNTPKLATQTVTNTRTASC